MIQKHLLPTTTGKLQDGSDTEKYGEMFVVARVHEEMEMLLRGPNKIVISQITLLYEVVTTAVHICAPMIKFPSNPIKTPHLCSVTQSDTYIINQHLYHKYHHTYILARIDNILTRHLS